MKFIRNNMVLSALIIFCISQFSHATESFPTQKSSIILSGSFLSQYRSSDLMNYWHTNITTSSGYFILNNLSLQILLGLSYDKRTESILGDYSDLSATVGGECRYYINKFNPYLFTSLAVSHNHNGELSDVYSYQLFQYSLGCNIFLSKHVSIEPLIYYMRLRTLFNYVGIKVGIGTFLYK